MIQLDIISDPICPYCYIGVTSLIRAMEQHPSTSLALNWRPFFLNPDMPHEGMDRQTYLAQKFGGAENAGKVYGQVAETAKAAGLSLHLDLIARTPNSLDAQRLIHWARIEGLQTPVAMALFRAYFQRGEDISDTDTLVRLAGGAGMDAGVVGKLLAGDADASAVTEAAREAATMGVTGVPTFILDAQYVITGAQPTAQWLSILDQLATSPV